MGAFSVTINERKQPGFSLIKFKIIDTKKLSPRMLYGIFSIIEKKIVNMTLAVILINFGNNQFLVIIA